MSEKERLSIASSNALWARTLKLRGRTVEMKMEESASEISCITDHEGFELVCLNVWVLQATYSSYRYRSGDVEEKGIRE